MKLIAVLIALASSPALAEFIYTGGGQLAEGFVHTNPGAPGGPDDSFSQTAGAVDFSPGFQIASATRPVPGGEVRTISTVGYFHTVLADRTLSIFIESSAEFSAPAGASGQVFSRGLVSLNFTITEGGVFEMYSAAHNFDTSSSLCRAVVRLTGEGLAAPIVDYNVVHDAEGYNEHRFVELVAGNYTLFALAEIDNLSDGPLGIGGTANVALFLDTVGTGACCVGSACTDGTYPHLCTTFVCDVTALLPESFAGCCGDVDGNGLVNAGDRGFISANIGLDDAELVCKFDLDGNGAINAGDRGFVSANIGGCAPLPDWQNGSGLNHGEADSRFPAATFQGVGTTCAAAACP